MGTIEKALRNSRHRTTTFIFEPVIGMVFDSRAEAFQFFNLYSFEVGFGIRFGSSARNRVNQYRTMQEIVCEREVSTTTIVCSCGFVLFCVYFWTGVIQCFIFGALYFCRGLTTGVQAALREFGARPCCVYIAAKTTAGM